MKDQDRLNLLKEVAGTTVYEERRLESLRIMQETSNKQEQIAVSEWSPVHQACVMCPIWGLLYNVIIAFSGIHFSH